MSNKEKIELIKDGSLFRVDTYEAQLSFLHDPELKKNIAYNLHFLEFLRRMWLNTNIKLSIEKSVFKVKIITLGSVMEAILHDVLKYQIPSGKVIFQKRWRVTERSVHWPYKDASDLIEKRFSAAIEELADEEFSDRSDLAWLIDLARANKIIGEPLTEQCHRLREYRNSVHTKILDQWEMFYYTAKRVDEAKECVRNLFSHFSPAHDRWILEILYSSTTTDSTKK